MLLNVRRKVYAPPPRRFYTAEVVVDPELATLMTITGCRKWIQHYLQRHLGGDWGIHQGSLDIVPLMNERSVAAGGIITSRFHLWDKDNGEVVLLGIQTENHPNAQERNSTALFLQCIHP